MAGLERLQIAEECGSEPHGAVEAEPVQPGRAAALPSLTPEAAALSRHLEQLEAVWRQSLEPSTGRAARKADGLRLSQRIREPAVAAAIRGLACSFAQDARNGLVPGGSEWQAVLLRRWLVLAEPLQLPRLDALLPEHLRQLQQACDAAQRNGSRLVHMMQAACSLVGLMGGAGRASSPSVHNDLVVQAEAARLVAAAQRPPFAALDTDTCTVCAGTDQPADEYSLQTEAAAKTLELGVLRACGCSVGLAVLIGGRAIESGFGSDAARIRAAERRPQPLAADSNLHSAFRAASMDPPPAIGVAHYRLWQQHPRHAQLVVACLAVPASRLAAPLMDADLYLVADTELRDRLSQQLAPPGRSARAADMQAAAAAVDGADAVGAAGGHGGGPSELAVKSFYATPVLQQCAELMSRRVSSCLGILLDKQDTAHLQQHLQCRMRSRQ